MKNEDPMQTLGKSGSSAPPPPASPSRFSTALHLTTNPPSSDATLATESTNTAAHSNGTFDECELCDQDLGCVRSVDMAHNQTDPCAPCTGCTIEMYPINGIVHFMGHEYPVSLCYSALTPCPDHSTTHERCISSSCCISSVLVVGTLPGLIEMGRRLFFKKRVQKMCAKLLV